MSYILLDDDQQFEPQRASRGGKHLAATPWEDRVRTGVRGAGQTLITGGVIVLLFVVYELWVTNIFNAREQNRVQHQLEENWENGRDPLAPGPGLPGEKIRSIPIGDGIAVMRIPAFGPDWGFVVVEGTGTKSLDIGPGHYVNSALPGDVGNFSVAGHRVGKGSPFLDLDKLKPGDAIVVETKDYWFTYRVMGDRASGNPEVGEIPGREIVSPSDVDVIGPVPGAPGQTANGKYITLTTCHPKFSAAQRLIIHGQLDGAPMKKVPGSTPPALGEG